MALALLVSSPAARAHELRPAVADVTVTPGQVTLEISLNAEAMLSGVDQSTGENTDNLPQAEAYDALRALPPEDLAARFRDEWPGLADGIEVRAGDTPVTLDLSEITVAEEPDASLPRDARAVITGALPEGDAPVTVGWQSEFGPLVLRQTGGGADAYSDFLNPGATSQPLPRSGEVVTEGWLPLFGRYIVVGFEHIIPLGLDHILFVLGLFFFSMHIAPLLWQVTAFTLAHTLTLALASLEIVTVPATIVEPLIAASIVYVAIENIFGTRLGWWRIAVVTAFGLLHGLGFASVLGDFGLDPSRFAAGLIGFNIGVEIGQLAVIALAYILVHAAVAAARRARMQPEEDPVRALPVMYRALSISVSLTIAAVGAFWVIERTLL